MKTISILTLGLLLISCGPRRPGKLGTAGKAGKAGTSMGIEVFDVPSGGACLSGGLTLSTFKDNNSNGLLDSSEAVVKTKLICNGLNGSAGQDGSNGNDGSAGADGQNGSNGTSASVSLESVAAGQECPSGGVKLSSSSSPNSQTICNGSNGLAGLAGADGNNGSNGNDGQDGSNGAKGENGLNGIAGKDGTIVTPVKFCSNDNSNFPEYGLMIGTELFAVYWGTTPASPNNAQAFLAKLTPGNYKSTGGNNCNFTIL